MNFANQSLELVFSPQAFAATRLGTGQSKALPQAEAEPALFLNFDTNLSYNAARGARSSNDLGILAELGHASNLGVATSSFVAKNLTRADRNVGREVVRLETTLSRDFPDAAISLRLGDGATRAGLMGRSTYFGGVQVSKNFGLTPGFVTQPIPVISGTSSAPSTVELYINDALRQTSSVPTGPFVIDNFPQLSGAGQARVVVRDVLGRETVLVQPFFSHANMLAKGLSDWSAEAGAVRENLGIESNDYGQRFVAGMVRWGLADQLTLEGRVEVTRSFRNAGLGLTVGLPWQLVGLAAVGASQAEADGSGREWVLGLEHDSLRHGFTVHAQGATRGWRQLGLEAALQRSRRELSASYSYSSEAWGSLGIGLARFSSAGQRPVSTVSANYSQRIGQQSSLTITVTRVLGAPSATALGVSMNVPLENRINVATSVSQRSGSTDAYVSASRSLSEETGLGWRALSGLRASRPYAEAGAYYQGNRILLTGDVSAAEDRQALRLGTQGAFVLIDGKFFASRRVQESFALVEVPGYAGIGVGFQGRPLTQTDAAGYALLPRLQPFISNSIRLDPTDLPINAELDTIEREVVPPARSAVKVTFPVRSGRGALIRLLLDDGEPAPAGAEIELAGDNKEFFVARRGEAFITGLQPSNTIVLKWKNFRCTVEVKLPPGNPEEIARVGPLTCPGVPR